MYRRNISGQNIYWSFTTISGGEIATGISGSISGQKMIGTTRSDLSGIIIEDGGICAALLHDFDIDGDQVGFQFIASGMVPRSFTVVTERTVSGNLHVASGVNATVPIASISGVIIDRDESSGINAIVPLATLSGVVADIAALSGVAVNKALLSGLDVNATANVNSGDIYLASGHFGYHSGLMQIASGPNVVVPIASISGVIVDRDEASGINAIVPIGQLSGTVPNILSGLTQIASGPNVVVPIASISGTIIDRDEASGINAIVPIASISGTVADVLSGTVYTASGVNAPWPYTNEGTARSGTAGTIQLATTAISGAEYYLDQLVELVTGSGAGEVRPITGFNGNTKIANVAPDWVIAPDGATTYRLIANAQKRSSTSGVIIDRAEASGVNAIVPIASISGTIIDRDEASGINATVPIATISGTNAVVPIGSISGTVVDVLSGLTQIASGPNVVVPITSISGVIIDRDEASGINAIVPVATLSGVVADIAALSGVAVNKALLSGLDVNATANVNSGDIWLASGHFGYHSGLMQIASGPAVNKTLLSGLDVTATANVASGDVWLASGHLGYESTSGLLAINKDLLSGLDVTATANVNSGEVYLASGHFGYHSGLMQPASGPNVTVPIASISGTIIDRDEASGINAIVPIASISGTIIDKAEASGVNAIVPIASVSGTTVVVPIGQLSGTIIDRDEASGINAIVSIASISGTIIDRDEASGIVADIAALSGVAVNKDLLSGLDVTATASVASGSTYLASGHFGYHSGLMQPASGANVTVPPASISGVHATVPPATLSGVVANSGLNVTVPSASISGANVTVPPASLSGVHETMVVEAGLDIREAMSINAAGLGGNLSGAGTASIQIAAAGIPGTNRIDATVDASGNRTSVTLNPS